MSRIATSLALPKVLELLLAGLDTRSQARAARRIRRVFVLVNHEESFRVSLRSAPVVPPAIAVFSTRWRSSSLRRPLMAENAARPQIPHERMRTSPAHSALDSRNAQPLMPIARRCKAPSLHTLHRMTTAGAVALARFLLNRTERNGTERNET